MEQITVPILATRREKIDALTGLRFIAAAMIVLHHSRGVLAVPQNFLSHFALHQGVAFFFVLSGFILAYVYPSLPDRRAVWRFLVARVARIWPLHAFTFGLGIALGLYSIGGSRANPTVAVAAANLGLVHAWVPTTEWFFSFNSVSWTISTEFFFYLTFPLLIANFPRKWWRVALLGAALLVGMVYLCSWLQLPRMATAPPNVVNRAGVLYIGPLARLAEFVLGMLTALLWQRRLTQLPCSPWKATIWECGVVALVVGAVAFFSDRPRLVDGVGEYWGTYLHHAGAAPAFALLILVFACKKGALSGFCATRPMVLLGEISFSIYMLHQLLLRWASGHRQLLSWSGEAVAYAVYWALLLGCSWLLWRWAEGPARRAILRLAPAR